MKRAIGALE